MTQKKWCEAQVQYQNSLALRDDAAIQATASQAADYCANPPDRPTAVPQTATPTETPTATTGNEPTITPTETPTPPPPEPTAGFVSDVTGTPAP